MPASRLFIFCVRYENKRGRSFRSKNLAGANFRGTDIWGADFSGERSHWWIPASTIG
ncbi:MAG: pentapeptide repeat-containing protein [Nostoc desertorum CM1-VF14]|nr:pentapeptide repeat-containing protein [Nostoc desertorum CM1-VF14]